MIFNRISLPVILSLSAILAVAVPVVPPRIEDASSASQPKNIGNDLHPLNRDKVEEYQNLPPEILGKIFNLADLPPKEYVINENMKRVFLWAAPGLFVKNFGVNSIKKLGTISNPPPVNLVIQQIPDEMLSIIMISYARNLDWNTVDFLIKNKANFALLGNFMLVAKAHDWQPIVDILKNLNVPEEMTPETIDMEKLKAHFSGVSDTFVDQIFSASLDGVKIEALDQLLRIAAINGLTKAVEMLLKAGVDLWKATVVERKTPLHFAIENGHLEVAKLLLKFGADINAKTSYGWTSLHFAASKNRLAELQLLIEAGADTEVQEINSLRTPLHVAAIQGHNQAVRLLVAGGGKVDARDEHGRTPLHFAAKEGKLFTARALLSVGADSNAKDENGNPPLNLAKVFLLWMARLRH